MAIQVTGSFPLKNSTFALNQVIKLSSNFSSPEDLTINVLISIPNKGLFIDNILYMNVDLSPFPSTETNLQLALLDSTHKYVKADLELKYPTCTFNIV